ncbi:HEAT repeat domain-containing protein [Spirillospora sp. NPDC048911]|uniref:HEAT repeat domain-containing protein n=1 Tax=Spirillospora sp. NPDC048911 TaxID=3364527 RepID=UPI00371C2682
MEIEAPELIELLQDPDPDVRRGAVWALRALSPGIVLPLLRDARRSGRGLARRRALEALLAVGGPDALDDRDRALLRRLIRFQIPAEVPAPMRLCGSWFALPTGDRAAVLDAFGLGDPEPVTMRLGGLTWHHDQHDGGGGCPGAAHRACSRVYVSPVLDGWTLVFGAPSDDQHRIGPGGDDAFEERLRDTMLARTAALSLRFGTVHWYGMGHRHGMDRADGWTAWIVAANGEVLRYYDAFEPDDQLGRPHPAEEGRLLPHERSLADGVESCDARTVAAQASVDPGALGPHTRVEGHGVVALTACGREYGHPRGALEI